MKYTSVALDLLWKLLFLTPHLLPALLISVPKRIWTDIVPLSLYSVNYCLKVVPAAYAVLLVILFLALSKNGCRIWEFLINSKTSLKKCSHAPCLHIKACNMLFILWQFNKITVLIHANHPNEIQGNGNATCILFEMSEENKYWEATFLFLIVWHWVLLQHVECVFEQPYINILMGLWCVNGRADLKGRNMSKCIW